MYNLKIGDRVTIRTFSNVSYTGEVTYILDKLNAIVLNNTHIVSCDNIKFLLRRG